MPTPQRSELYVEGKDDHHVVEHLLFCHGIILHDRSSQTAHPNAPCLKEMGGKDQLLKGNAGKPRIGTPEYSCPPVVPRLFKSSGWASWGFPTFPKVTRTMKKDDQHVVERFLLRHGIILPDRSSQTAHPNAPCLKEMGGKDELLKVIRTMETAFSRANGLSVGFVLDADDKPQDRWNAVRGCLQGCGLDPPEEMRADGYVADAAKFKARVGVWLMPDNRQVGALEEFLVDLIPQSDSLFPFAQSATEDARTHYGAKFTASKQSKAVLHAWLAWQAKPGKPYGTAIRSQFFHHDSPAALAFIAWYRRLFHHQASSTPQGQSP